MLDWLFGRFGRSETVRKRIEPRVHRHYAGASSGPIYADFIPSYLSADNEIVQALAKLRARARNLERNNGHARRFIQLMQDNVVGHSGFRLQVKAKVVSTGELRTVANNSVEDAWNNWAREPVTIDGTQNFALLTSMVVRTWARDGESFIQILTGPDYPDRLALKPIEADLVDETLNGNYRPTGNEIRMGVEIDVNERPVAYHVLSRHPGDHQWVGRLTARKEHVRVPASQMIHVFQKRRPHQTRGEPPLAPVMNDIKLMAGYREAEMTLRRVAASKMGFFTRDDDSGPVSGLADAEEDDGELISEVEPGRVQVLPRGYSFDQFDPNTGSMDFSAFEKQIVRSIAAGLGPSYADLAMDLTDVSYSSIRQGALSDRDFYRSMQAFFISRFAWIVYGRWLGMNIGLHPDIPVLATQGETFRRASKFIPRGWNWVDPQKEVKAAIEAIDNNLSSRSKVVAEQGGDFSEVVVEKKAENAAIAEADLKNDTLVSGENGG